MRLVRSLLSPAIRPLGQVVASITLLASVAVAFGGFFAEMPLSQDRKLYLICNLELQRLVCNLELQRLENALVRYKSNCGKYPKKLQGLIANEGVQGWNGPYLKDLPLDPWHRPFQYLKSSDADAPEILSYGADGKPGGDFFDSDISSRALWRGIPETSAERRSRWIRVGVWLGAWICFGGSIVLLTKTSRRKVDL